MPEGAAIQRDWSLLRLNRRSLTALESASDDNETPSRRTPFNEGKSGSVRERVTVPNSAKVPTSVVIVRHLMEIRVFNFHGYGTTANVRLLAGMSNPFH